VYRQKLLCACKATETARDPWLTLSIVATQLPGLDESQNRPRSGQYGKWSTQCMLDRSAFQPTGAASVEAEHSASSQGSLTDRLVSFRPEFLGHTRRKIETHNSMQVEFAAPACGEVSQPNSVSSFAAGISELVPSFTCVKRVLLAVQHPTPLNQ